MSSNITVTQEIQCPYCWEHFEIIVDCSEDSQAYVEDCWVCCRPIELSVEIDEFENVSVVARSQDE